MVCVFIFAGVIYINTLIISKPIVASLGLSLLFFSPGLTLVFPVPGIVAASAFLSLFIGIYVQGGRVLKKGALVFLLLFFVYFLITPLVFNVDHKTYIDYFSTFIIYGMCGFIYSSINFDHKFLYRLAVLFSLVISPVVYLVVFYKFIPSYVTDTFGYYMRVSHVVSMFLFILFYNSLQDDSKIIRVVSFCLASVFFIFMITFGARSFLLAFMLFFIFFVIKKYKSFNFKFVFIVLVFMFVLYSELYSIMIWFNSLLSDYNVESRSLIRLIYIYESNEDLSSGRYWIWGKGFEGFLNSPIIGNGIASFENKYNYYVHNFVLQLLYEGGLILAVPVICVLVKFGLVLFDKNISAVDWFFIFMIFFGGVFYLFFSGVIWSSVYIWFFIGWVINYKTGYSSMTKNLTASV